MSEIRNIGLPIALISGAVAYGYYNYINNLKNPPIVDPYYFKWYADTYTIDIPTSSYIDDIGKYYGGKGGIIDSVKFVPIFDSKYNVISSKFVISVTVWNNRVDVDILGKSNLSDMAALAKKENKGIHLFVKFKGLSDTISQVLYDDFHYLVNPNNVIKAQYEGLDRALGGRTLTREEINALPTIPEPQLSEAELRSGERGVIMVPIGSYL